MRYFSTSLFLLSILVVIICGLYPLALWCVGQTIFPFQANGSMLKDTSGRIVGSKLIAQAFTQDEYFQPRPSAAAYDAAASSSSALAASNYALRDRIARSIGPIAKYIDNTPVAPDIEKWFQQDKYDGMPGIVAQWALNHNSLAQAWVSADPQNTAYVENWMATHPEIVAQYIKDNPGNPKPKATDLAVAFFQSFSKQNPGKFPVANPHIAAVGSGIEIQATFFDMWRQDNKDANLKRIPADMLTTSASGLDPHITIQNAQMQIVRVAQAWATRIKKDPSAVVQDIMQILNAKTEAPLYGLIGEPIVNVLELNLELQKHFNG